MGLAIYLYSQPIMPLRILAHMNDIFTFIFYIYCVQKKNTHLHFLLYLSE